jgi:hypothetical protein
MWTVTPDPFLDPEAIEPLPTEGLRTPADQAEEATRELALKADLTALYGAEKADQMMAEDPPL